MIKIFPFIVKTFGLYGSHKRKLFPFMYLKQSAHRVDPKKLNETHLSNQSKVRRHVQCRLCILKQS